MKFPFILSVTSAGLCLVMSIVLLIQGFTTNTLNSAFQKQQQELQTQQQEMELKKQSFQTQEQQITAGTQIAQKVGPELLNDIASLSVKNEKLKKLLKDHGYDVKVEAPAEGAATPAPATPKP